MLASMGEVFIGSEALANGLITRHELQRFHTRILPDVYHPRGRALSLQDRIVAAWLWSGRRAVVAGVAASALHGARWVDPNVSIELIRANSRSPKGVLVRHETLAHDEITTFSGMAVTTVTRTAFDLGRHLPRAQALARLDALAWTGGLHVGEVVAVADRNRGARGIRRLRAVLPLVDGGAASPKETWLRLLLIDAGFPNPETQIALSDARGLAAVLDMGWQEFRVGAEYDGDQHRYDRRQYVWDQKRSRIVAGLGWKRVQVIKEDHPDDVIARVRKALISRGWHPEIDVTQASSRALSA